MKYWLLALIISLSIGVLADSLWPEDYLGYYVDFKARQVGDILFVTVSEQASANAKASTSTDKTESAASEVGIGKWFDWIPEMGMSGTTKSDANGSTNRSDSLVTQICVVVKEVLPNGNLVIEGTRIITINKEIRKVELTGVIRVRDITPNNTISSSLIANADIKYDGKGPIGHKQRDGIITQIFKLLF